MKKIILLFTLALVTQFSMAQKTVYHTHPEVLFNQGKEMFLEGNWVGAQELLTGFATLSNDSYLKEEAAYMVAISSFHRGNKTSGNILKEFLTKYPETIHRHQVNFLIGSYYYDKRDWETAGIWFGLTDLDYLTLTEQEDYSFRSGYTQLQSGNKEEARRYFGLLSQNSNKYRDAANFYLGYIEYINRDYSGALRRFERLKNNPEYQEEVAFYTAQATFFDGEINDAIKLSEAFVSRYPSSEHVSEMYRVLGNSYYRQGQPSRAITFYEKYIAGNNRPLRGDAYFMGLSYSDTGKYNDAVNMFQQAVGEPDALSQNAQLQLGHTYLKMNQKQQAQMAFEAATRDNYDPQVRETALFNYALLAHETNFSVFSESITLFENFLSEYPNSQYISQVNNILAETFLTTKDYTAAINAINRIKNPGRRIMEAKQMVLFQLGAQEFINGNMNQAVQHFNNSISLGNYDVKARNSAYYWRGEAYYRIGNYSNAVNDFRQFTQNAISSDENYALGWYGMGYALFKQQQYIQAANAFMQYISAETNRNRPEYADAMNRVGDSHYFNRNFSEAERYYGQAATANPDIADYASYQRAFVMGLQRNYQGKIEALDNLIRRYPNSQYYDDALYEKSRALTMLNRENEAITVLHKLVTDYPKSPIAGQGGVQLGQLYYNSGNYQQSIAAYKNVISNFPGSDDARNALVSLETVYREINDIDSYVRYANSLPGGMRITPSRQDSLTYLAAENVYMRGNRTDAELAMTRYLQSYPNGAYSSDANYYLGVIADEKGDKQQALTHFRKVIDASNVKFLDNALIYTSQTEYKNGNLRQALADYSRLANSARNATNKQIGQMGVIRAQSQLGGYHEAVRAATELLAGNNLSAETVTEARYLRGKAYQQINETDNAMADFQFIAKDTRSIYGAEAQFIIADTYYRWKSYDRAEAQVKEFMQKSTPHQYWMARALIVLSDTYMAKGDRFQALQYLESLRTNYKGGEADISQMIDERLK
ncbi:MULTISPECIES: tetratricopeptide repeat protein [unclassified Proteiniphilum]|jgi:TolA-binding protein|uniref:tetratricopeptide repeat protein n=1 Tax=unclassified Proteiniphilum TaxID=2622718 RepID=UPI0025807BA4|nr:MULTISPECIES: tetratricopeptide repeat protein [unclassified Proteiniphilum]